MTFCHVSTLSFIMYILYLYSYLAHNQQTMINVGLLKA